MFKISNRNTRKKCEICSKITIKRPEFIVNFEHISHLVLVFLVNFEQVNAGWAVTTLAHNARKIEKYRTILNYHR